MRARIFECRALMSLWLAMVVAQAVRGALIVASVLISAMLSSAQDTPMGDVARAARAEESQAPQASKVVTDEDLGPQLKPVSETDDPMQVLDRARRAWLTDMPRTCHNFGHHNSGPGSSGEVITEIAAHDRGRIITIQRGGLDPGRVELIVMIGNDIYSRRSTGPWSKYSADEAVAKTMAPMNKPPEELNYTYGAKLVGRGSVEGSPTFQYEVKFHPFGVETGERTIDFWVGANDNLLRRIDVLTKEVPPSPGAGLEYGGTTTCSYGPVPEIKPPI